LSPTVLASDEIPVWWLASDAAEPADLRRWLDMLDAEERERAARFWVDLDRREYIAAHALLRVMLTHYIGQPVQEWRFSIGEYGKPMITSLYGGSDLDFNLAHTRGLVAAAITSQGRIGIDVERIDPAKSDTAIATDFFAPAELALLRRSPPADWPHWFFRLWTLKEAYIKALGTGLNTRLQSFAFTFDPIRIALASDAGADARDWHFAMETVTPEHVLSVAAYRPDRSAPRVVTRAIAANEL
jgi:4'-phosphopantetheinyl transferase